MAILKSKELVFSGDLIICNVSYVEEESPETGAKVGHVIGNPETTSVKWKTKSFSSDIKPGDILSQAESEYLDWNNGKAEA